MGSYREILMLHSFGFVVLLATVVGVWSLQVANKVLGKRTFIGCRNFVSWACLGFFDTESQRLRILLCDITS